MCLKLLINDVNTALFPWPKFNFIFLGTISIFNVYSARSAPTPLRIMSPSVITSKSFNLESDCVTRKDYKIISVLFVCAIMVKFFD